jgi:hypothetical protein
MFIVEVEEHVDRDKAEVLQSCYVGRQAEVVHCLFFLRYVRQLLQAFLDFEAVFPDGFHGLDPCGRPAYIAN